MFDFDAHWTEVFAVINSPKMTNALNHTVRGIAHERRLQYEAGAPVCIYLHRHGSELRLLREILNRVGFSDWETHHSQFPPETYDIDEIISYFRQNRDQKLWWIFPGSRWAKFQVQLANTLMPSVSWIAFKMFTNKYTICDAHHRLVFDLWAWSKLKPTIGQGDAPSLAFRKFCQESESFAFGMNDEEVFAEATFFSPEIVFQDCLAHSVRECIDDTMIIASGQPSLSFYSEMTL